MPGERRSSSVAPWRVLRGYREPGSSPSRFGEQVSRALGQGAAPVNVDQVLKRLGIQLIEVSSVRWSGAVKSDGDAAAIWVRTDDTPVRQRFTLAHELGHLLLHPNGVAFRDDTFSGGPLEAEANEFAAGLLMPAYLLRTYIGRTSDVVTLSKAFHTSEHAMRVRLQKLGVTQRDRTPSPGGIVSRPHERR